MNFVVSVQENNDSLLRSFPGQIKSAWKSLGLLLRLVCIHGC